VISKMVKPFFCANEREIGNMSPQKSKIRNWKQFARKIRPRGGLLSRLDNFPNCVMITGCQRSGTTMLSRIITQSNGMVDYRFGKDDELDAALILSGQQEISEIGRYCFQTTYLNDGFREYLSYNNGYRLVWVLRNPFSVVYSLVHHWRRWALNELFRSCGADLLENRLACRYKRWGSLGIPKALRGCLSYNGKIMQLFELKQKLPKGSIKVVEYDEIVKSPDTHLKRIYEYIDLPYHKRYCDSIHAKSTEKKDRMSDKERDLVSRISLPLYEKAKGMLD
jgi:hypothetical protein